MVDNRDAIRLASQNLFELIKRSRYLSLNLKNIIDPVIQRNRYFAHPENILLTTSMLTVERCAKLVTEASSAACGQVSRDEFIRARLESRKIMKQFHTKAQYATKKEIFRRVGTWVGPGGVRYATIVYLKILDS
nr:unnamed protein product [Callosobruchus analis]